MFFVYTFISSWCYFLVLLARVVGCTFSFSCGDYFYIRLRSSRRLYFLFVSVVVSFTSVPLKPRRLILCPERQRMQSALRECWRAAVAVNFSALRLCIGKAYSVSLCVFRRKNTSLRKNLHYYSSIYRESSRTAQLKVNSVEQVRSARPFTTLRNGQALLVCPFGNGIPTFADRCRGGFKFMDWVRLYSLISMLLFYTNVEVSHTHLAVGDCRADGG